MKLRLAGALIVGLLVACADDVQPPRVTTELAAGWTELPAPPIVRARAASVWTGKELVYWGGDTDFGSTHHADGAAYDPGTRRWRRIPSGPLSGRSTPGAVWTGTEVVLWGGSPASGDGAAFDPEAGTWRALPPAPLSPRAPVAAVWTGQEVLVWGNASRNWRANDGAAYEPAADRWRPLPPAPLALNTAQAVWTGEEMVVFGAHLDRNNASRTEHAQGIAYRPETDGWRVIAPRPLSPQASTVAWTGDRVLVWDYELTAGVYDPARDVWAGVPDLPLSDAECYPESVVADGFVFAWYCGVGALYDVESGTWKRVPSPEDVVFGRPVSAGSVVLFAGAAHEGSANGLLAFRP